MRDTCHSPGPRGRSSIPSPEDRRRALSALVSWARQDSLNLKSRDIRLEASGAKPDHDRHDRLMVDILLRQGPWPSWLGGHLSHYRHGVDAFVTKTETRVQEETRIKFLHSLTDVLREES
jgi:hypothetical protein